MLDFVRGVARGRREVPAVVGRNSWLSTDAREWGGAARGYGYAAVGALTRCAAFGAAISRNKQQLGTNSRCWAAWAAAAATMRATPTTSTWAAATTSAASASPTPSTTRQAAREEGAPKRPSSKAGRSLGPKPISSDVGTKTFKKASASDVLAKAQAMLAKAPTGSGQRRRRKVVGQGRRRWTPTASWPTSLPQKTVHQVKDYYLETIRYAVLDPDSSFAEDEAEADLQPQQATSPVNDDDDENILNSEIARQSVYGQVRDASALVQEEEVSEDEVAEEEEEENPPLTETAKAQFTSSIHGNVRSITDLPSRLGSAPTRDSSQFEFGAEVLQSPRAPAAAPSQSPQKFLPSTETEDAAPGVVRRGARV